jgi:hypothetical protein
MIAELPGETEEKSRNSSERHPVFRSNFSLSPPKRGVPWPDHVAVLCHDTVTVISNGMCLTL